LKAHRRELIDPKIAEYGGRIVKTTGDGLLLEFASVGRCRALRCRRSARQCPSATPAFLPIGGSKFRIGINVGDIIIDETISSAMVSTSAARLQTLAEPGGICVSRVVRDQVLDKLSFSFDDLGAQEVKNIVRRSKSIAWRSMRRPAAPVGRGTPRRRCTRRGALGAADATCLDARLRCRCRRGLGDRGVCEPFVHERLPSPLVFDPGPADDLRGASISAAGW
jgi:hypothetical protein